MYYILLATIGQAFPVVVWQGDDPVKAREAYENTVNDRDSEGAYVMLVARALAVEKVKA